MKDNNTGKNSDFYALGKKMFDRLNPPGTPAFKPYFPKREWVGLTDEERINLSYKAEGNECVAVELTEDLLMEKNT